MKSLRSKKSYNPLLCKGYVTLFRKYKRLLDKMIVKKPRIFVLTGGGRSRMLWLNAENPAGCRAGWWKCWRDQAFLELHVNPEPIALSVKVKTISVGSTHVLAVSTDGKVYGWGSNNFGQSGGGAYPFFNKPKLISFPEKISAVAAGMHFSLALASSGKVYAWGWNGFGQLGLGDLQPRSNPTLISNLYNVRSIAAGEMHAIALGKNDLLGWGNNASRS